MDINGYFNDPEKGLCVWLQQRSFTKQRWPGKWDNMVISFYIEALVNNLCMETCISLLLIDK